MRFGRTMLLVLAIKLSISIQGGNTNYADSGNNCDQPKKCKPEPIPLIDSGGNCDADNRGGKCTKKPKVQYADSGGNCDQRGKCRFNPKA